MDAEKDNMKTSDLPDIIIPGINTSAGIKQCGGFETYLELLGDIYGLIDKKSDETERFLETGDLRAFTTNVHSLKTTCRMLGHSELSDSFFELEKLGKEGSLEKAAALTPGVLSRFRGLKPLLEPYLPKAETKRFPFSAEDIAALLTELECSLEDFDINSAEVTMKKLLAYECGKELSDNLLRLSELVNDLEYDEASELAGALKITISR